jgi:hypothetical protein
LAETSVQKASSSGDVCEIRPDLCGGAPKAKKKKKLAKKKKCRQRNDERDEVLDLPVCGSETADLAGDIEKEIMMDEVHAAKAAGVPKSELQKRQAPAKEEELSFDEPVHSSRVQGSHGSEKLIRPMNYNDYINKNANHPALASRRSRHDQTAFVEPKRVYISPTGNMSATGLSAAGNGTGNSATPAGAAAPGGATTASPGANPATGTSSGIPAAPGIAPAAGIAPVQGTAGGDPNQTNNYGSDGNQPPPGSSGGN